MKNEIDRKLLGAFGIPENQLTQKPITANDLEDLRSKIFPKNKSLELPYLGPKAITVQVTTA